MAARKAKVAAVRGTDMPEAPEKPKGEDQEAVLYRSQSSVMVKRDAKGTRSYEVKAYADTPDEAVAQAQSMAEAIDGFIDGLNRGKE